MIGLVLSGHGTFASGIASALSMVAGDQPHVSVVTVADEGAADYPARPREAVEREVAACEGVVVFVDLLGGTPFNQAMLLGAEHGQVRIVTGANLPMLIETLFLRNLDARLTADDAVAIALSSGRAAVEAVSLADTGIPDRPEGPADGEGI